MKLLRALIGLILCLAGAIMMLAGCYLYDWEVFLSGVASGCLSYGLLESKLRRKIYNLVDVGDCLLWLVLFICIVNLFLLNDLVHLIPMVSVM